MNIVKSVVKAVWPIIYRVLQKAADNTETKLDDIAVEAANTAVEEWLMDTQEEIEFK